LPDVVEDDDLYLPSDDRPINPKQRLDRDITPSMTDISTCMLRPTSSPDRAGTHSSADDPVQRDQPGLCWGHRLRPKSPPVTSRRFDRNPNRGGGIAGAGPRAGTADGLSRCRSSVCVRPSGDPALALWNADDPVLRPHRPPRHHNQLAPGHRPGDRGEYWGQGRHSSAVRRGPLGVRSDRYPCLQREIQLLFATRWAAYPCRSCATM
jgi:hypothetical protein